MLRDKVEIEIESGLGGAGSDAIMMKRRIGGDGGHGGSVFFKGSTNVYDLNWYTFELAYRAEDGKNGQSRNHKGEDGKDLVLIVPLTTEISVDGGLLYKIQEDGQMIKVLEGGAGALGNISLKAHTNEELSDAHRVNQKGRASLVLKLKSDVIFMGYPNAGKSSMLNELSGARVKTAAYAFTTLEPQLGLMDGYRLMDLPGLIEGTSEGKGLGTKFVKHTEYSTLVAHFVSLENEDPMKIYKTLRAEIKKISPELYAKEELIVLTKTDESTPEKTLKIEKQFKKLGLEVIACSIIDDQSIANLKAKLKEML